MEIWKICLTAAAGYLFGSISVAILVCRGLYGADVRERGSGNAGATNVARVFGMKAGVITFAGDLLKTAAALLLGAWLLGEPGQMHCRLRMPCGALLAPVFWVSGRQGRHGQRGGGTAFGSKAVFNPCRSVFPCVLFCAHRFHLLNFRCACIPACNVAPGRHFSADAADRRFCCGDGLLPAPGKHKADFKRHRTEIQS